MASREAKAVQSVFVISDSKDGETRAIAIHRILDSAAACYNHLIRTGDFERFLEMTHMRLNEYGYITSNELLYTFTKSTGITIDHRTGQMYRTVKMEKEVEKAKDIGGLELTDKPDTVTKVDEWPRAE